MRGSSEVQLVSASRVSFGQRVAIMNAAYADYYVPMRVTPEQIAQLDRCHDVDVSRSVVARARWESVGMGMLALRGQRAWISGVGVMPAWRRRGVAQAMMRYLIEKAREAGVDRVSLEVIDQNQPAQNLYIDLGFCIQRELLTWRRSATAEPLPIPLERLTPVAPEVLLGYADGWRDQAPCWQRETGTLRKMADQLKGYRLDWRDEPTAYCVLNDREDTVTLVDIGLNPDAGLLMPGRLLLQALAALYVDRPVSIINVPADDSLNRILAALGFLVTVRQLEMVLDLTPT